MQFINIRHKKYKANFPYAAPSCFGGSGASLDLLLNKVYHAASADSIILEKEGKKLQATDTGKKSRNTCAEKADRLTTSPRVLFRPKDQLFF